MGIANAVNANQQGVQYLDTTGIWSGIDGSTAGDILTSNGTGVAPSFQANIGGISTYFMAWINSTYSSVTGDGTVYPMIFDTITSNVGSGYNNGTGVFTVPVGQGGLYYFSASIPLSGFLPTHTGMLLYIQNTTTPFNSAILGLNPYVIYGNTAFGNNSLWIVTNGMAQCNDGDTINVFLQVSNGSKVITVNPANSAQFSGFRIGV